MKYVKYSLLAAIFGLLVFACGEVGNGEEVSGGSSSSKITGNSSSSAGGGNSSSGTVAGTSSSSNETSVCQGLYCCNGMPYDHAINFCKEDQLYPKCNGKEYDPYEQGCFEGKLYPKCSLEKTRGTCVHESLLRCRQEGTGEDKIIKPQPGMTCEENGIITGITLDALDNNRVYKIVQIGNQMWLAENVKFDPSIYPPEISIAKNGKCYGNTAANCENYGYLYDWATAMALPENCNGTNQNCPNKAGASLWPGLCPPSFAVARSEDWQALVNYAGGADVAGGRLKSKSGWSNNGNGTDSYGFNALPSGYYTELMPEGFIEQGSRAVWWHETQLMSEAHYTTIISSDTEAKTNFQQKSYYMAGLRCLHYF
ncbi:MAG: hypothetical protein FWC26_09415 [Fibromonadales bacterium]|nr:hypothetical protein [Fibromonadales bacterium]